VNNGTFGLGNINKICGRANGGGASACLNGGAIVTGAGNALRGQGTAFTHVGVGNRGAGDTPLNGYFKRITYWDRELTDGEMMTYTRSDSIYGN
jgi:hypothetical protein